MLPARNNNKTQWLSQFIDDQLHVDEDETHDYIKYLVEQQASDINKSGEDYKWVHERLTKQKFNRFKNEIA